MLRASSLLHVTLVPNRNVKWFSLKLHLIFNSRTKISRRVFNRSRVPAFRQSIYGVTSIRPHTLPYCAGVVRPISASHRSLTSVAASSTDASIYCTTSAECVEHGSTGAPSCHWLYEGCPTGQCMCDPIRQKRHPATGKCISGERTAIISLVFPIYQSTIDYTRLNAELLANS
jgi:hypothetical protein